MRLIIALLVLALPLLVSGCTEVPADYDYGQVANFGRPAGFGQTSGNGGS